MCMVQRGEHCGLLVFFFLVGLLVVLMVDLWVFVGWIWWCYVYGVAVVVTAKLLPW